MTYIVVPPNQTEVAAVNGDTVELPNINLVPYYYKLHITQPTVFTSLFIVHSGSDVARIGGSLEVRLEQPVYGNKLPQFTIFQAENDGVPNPSGITVAVAYHARNGKVWWVYDNGTQKNIINDTSNTVSQQVAIRSDYSSRIYIDRKLETVFYNHTQDQVYEFPVVEAPQFNSLFVVPASTDIISGVPYRGMPLLLDYSTTRLESKPKIIYVYPQDVPFSTPNNLYPTNRGYWVVGATEPSVPDIGLPDTGEGAKNTGGLDGTGVNPDILGTGDGGGISSTNSGGGSNTTGTTVRNGGGIPTPPSITGTTSRVVVPGNDGYLYSMKGDYKINLLTGVQESWDFNTQPLFGANNFISLIIEGSGLYGGASSVGLVLGEIGSNYYTYSTNLGNIPLGSLDYQSIYQCYNPVSRQFIRTQRGSSVFTISDIDRVVGPAIRSVGISAYLRAVCTKPNSPNFIGLSSGGSSSSISKLIEFNALGSIINQNFIDLDGNSVIKMFGNDNLLIVAAPPILNIYDINTFNLVETHIIPNDILSTQICYSEDNRFLVSNSNNSYGAYASNGYPYPSCTIFSGLLSASGCTFDGYYEVNKYTPILNTAASGGGYVTVMPSPYSVDRLGIDTSINKAWAFTTIGGSSVFTYDLPLSGSTQVSSNSQRPIGTDIATRIIRIKDYGTSSKIYLDQNLNAGHVPIESYDNSNIIELSLYSTDKYDLRIYDD